MIAVSQAGEFDIIERYFSRAISDDAVLLGIGDDAAVIDAHQTITVTVDTLVCGVHFPVDTAPAYVGHRILAVNLSDIAAMGAKPRWCTLALTLSDADPNWLEEFARGLFDLAERYSVQLIGGDLTRGPLTASLQLIGTLEGGAALTRAGAAVGDDVYVSGPLGDSGAGLDLIKQGHSPADRACAQLIDRFYLPQPRVDAGLALNGLASAAIDISDGLAADLGHICERSACGARVDLDRLPLSDELLTVHSLADARAFAIHAGDDYELCFTAAPQRAQAIEATMRDTQTPARKIGYLDNGRDVRFYSGGKPVSVSGSGFVHF